MSNVKKKLIDYALTGPAPWTISGALGGAMSGGDEGRAKRALYGAAGGLAGGVAGEQAFRHVSKAIGSGHALLGQRRLQRLIDMSVEAAPLKGSTKSKKLRILSKLRSGKETHPVVEGVAIEKLKKALNKNPEFKPLTTDIGRRLERAAKAAPYIGAAGGAIGNTIGTNEGLKKLRKIEEAKRQQKIEESLYGE